MIAQLSKSIGHMILTCDCHTGRSIVKGSRYALLLSAALLWPDNNSSATESKKTEEQGKRIGLSIGSDLTSAKRPAKVADAYKIEGLGRYYGGPVSYSPDTGKIAITRVRPAAMRKDFSVDFLLGNDIGDVWVRMPDGRFFNVTRGAEDGSGWWAPQWSPDGRFLAMLSTRGAKVPGEIFLWLWDSQKNALRRLSGSNVAVGIGGIDAMSRPFIWLDAENLLCPFIPKESKFKTIKPSLWQVIGEMWPKMAAGNEVTASVLDSGVQSRASQQSIGKLVRINAKTGHEVIVSNGKTEDWLSSPNSRYVAFSRQVGVYLPRPGELVETRNEKYTVEVADYNGKLIWSASGIANDVIAGSVRWSGSGDKLAFISYSGSRGELPQLFEFDVRTRRLRKIDTGALDLGYDSETLYAQKLQIEWTADEKILVRGAERVADGRPAADARRDWWLVSLDGKRRNITQGLKSIPAELWRRSDNTAFVGVSGGELWLLRPTSGSVENLTQALLAPVTGIAWPAPPYSSKFGKFGQYRGFDASYERVYIYAEEADRRHIYAVDLASGETLPAVLPDENASLLAVSPNTGDMLLVRDDNEGLRLWWRRAGSKSFEVLFDANSHLREIEQPKMVKIRYRSLEGEMHNGWIMLPHGYKAGRRYPLVTIVYATTVYGDDPPKLTLSAATTSQSASQILAGRGYAVLLPSMPTQPAGVAKDPMFSMPNGVLPAVDKAIELGIADPKRLFVMGQSYGGYSVNGLIAQTNLFRAAVSMSGTSNTLSKYGSFEPNIRYLEAAHEQVATAFVESAIYGAAPWQNSGKYLRNSPLMYADRINTPVMFIHGDLDYVPIQQSEELFYALYRQGKRAKFVRYWGEGHAVLSPANATDMWERVFQWFEMGE